MSIKHNLLIILLLVAGCRTYSSSFGDYADRNTDLTKLKNSETDKICQSVWFDTSQNPDRYINSKILPQYLGKTNPIFIEYTIIETMAIPIYRDYCVTVTNNFFRLLIPFYPQKYFV